jgi:hypothetical protein
VRNEVSSTLFRFGDRSGLDQSLISTVHRLGNSTILFGSYPSGIHLIDLRQPFPVFQNQDIPKLPSVGQATPLCIRSSPADDFSFLVCGRFPAVLLGDLRLGLRNFRSVYSGADSLSSITSISRDHIVLAGAYRGIPYCMYL